MTRASPTRLLRDTGVISHDPAGECSLHYRNVSKSPRATRGPLYKRGLLGPLLYQRRDREDFASRIARLTHSKNLFVISLEVTLSPLHLGCVGHLSHLGRTQNGQEIAVLVPEVAEPLHQPGRKRNRVPGTQGDLILAFVAPVKGPLTREGNKHLDCLVAVQRGSFPRSDLRDCHSKTMRSRARWNVLGDLADDAEGIHAFGDIAHAHGLVVDGLELFETGNPLEHLFLRDLNTCHKTLLFSAEISPLQRLLRQGAPLLTLPYLAAPYHVNLAVKAASVFS